METELTEEEWLLNMWERICKNNPNSPLCTGKLESTGNGSIQYRDPEVSYNFSTSTILDLLRRQRQSEDASDRIVNKITTLEELYSKLLPDLQKIGNESLSIQKENERKIRSDSNLRWILGFLIGISVIIGVVGWRFRKYKKKERALEGYI